MLRLLTMISRAENRPIACASRVVVAVLSVMTLAMLGACEREAAPNRNPTAGTSEAGDRPTAAPEPQVQIIDPARQAPQSLPPDQQRLPLTRILQIAGAAVPGEVIEVELDDDDDEPPEYEVTILTAQGRKMEVKIDARNGNVLEIEED